MARLRQSPVVEGELAGKRERRLRGVVLHEMQEPLAGPALDPVGRWLLRPQRGEQLTLPGTESLDLLAAQRAGRPDDPDAIGSCALDADTAPAQLGKQGEGGRCGQSSSSPAARSEPPF